MYIRTSQIGHPVEWHEDGPLAQHSMEIIDGTGVSDASSLDSMIEVDSETAKQVREVFKQLRVIEDNDGEDSALDYSNPTTVQQRYEEINE